MPSKNIAIIAGTVGLIIVLFVAGYFAMNKKSAQNPQNPETATSQEATSDAQTKGSIKSLLSAGKNQTCTIKYPQADQMGQGTVYVSASKVRGDFLFTSEGKAFDSHMIQDGEFMYSWSSASTQGTKMKTSDLEKVQPSPTSGQVDLNSEVNLDCSAWSVDNAKFSPPSNITFTDITQSMNQSQQSPTTQTKTGGSVCNQITDPAAKAACLQQLSY